MNREGKLLILAAMPQEEKALLECLNISTNSARLVSEQLKVAVREAKIRESNVLIGSSGVGPVNAAITLATIAEKEKLRAVILLGVGGALSPQLQIGDLVVSTGIIQHDSYASFDEGNCPMRAGSYLLSAQDEDSHEVLLKADEELIEWIFPKNTGASKSWKGIILSGSEFVGTVDRKREIARLHPGALMVEMEGAGVAQIANRLNIPFVVAKTVADRLNPDGSIGNDFLTCLDAACKNAAEVVKNIL